VPTPPITVVMNPDVASACLGHATCAAAPGTIWWDGQGMLPTMLRAAFLHELGHVFDMSVMTDADRARFTAIIHDPRPWYVVTAVASVVWVISLVLGVSDSTWLLGCFGAIIGWGGVMAYSYRREKRNEN
jgi:hypothetical protein